MRRLHGSADALGDEHAGAQPALRVRLDPAIGFDRLRIAKRSRCRLERNEWNTSPILVVLLRLNPSEGPAVIDLSFLRPDLLVHCPQ
jgi:hypothetical protein